MPKLRKLDPRVCNNITDLSYAIYFKRTLNFGEGQLAQVAWSGTNGRAGMVFTEVNSTAGEEIQ